MTYTAVKINFQQVLLKKLFPTMNILKVRIFNIKKPEVRERKKTGLHGKQLLSKTLNSRINIIETRAVLNIVKTEGKWAPECKREGLELIRRCFSHGDSAPFLDSRYISVYMFKCLSVSVFQYFNVSVFQCLNG